MKYYGGKPYKRKAGYNIEILFANRVNFSDCEVLTNSIMERLIELLLVLNKTLNGKICYFIVLCILL